MKALQKWFAFILVAYPYLSLGSVPELDWAHCSNDLEPFYEDVFTGRHTEYSGQYAYTVKEYKRRFGYREVATGRIVIPAKYKDVHKKFCEGLAGVKEHRYWSFINKFGEVALEGEWTKALPFYQGNAPVQLTHRWTWINRAKKQICPAEYYLTKHFVNGLAPASIIDPKTEEIKAGFVDEKCHMAIPATYDETFPFGKKLGAFRKGDTYGLVDRTGYPLEITIKDFKGYWSEDTLAVLLKDGWTFLDEDGKIFTVFYNDVLPFWGGIAAVQSSVALTETFFTQQYRHWVSPLRWGYLTRNNQWLQTPRWINADYFAKGSAKVVFYRREPTYKGENCFIVNARINKAGSVVEEIDKTRVGHVEWDDLGRFRDKYLDVDGETRGHPCFANSG